MGKNQGDGLRMFILNKLGELLRIDLAEIVEYAEIGFKRLVQPRNELAGRFFAIGFDEYFLRVIDATSHEQLLEVTNWLYSERLSSTSAWPTCSSRAMAFAKPVGFLFGQMLEDLGAFARPNGDQEYGGFLQAGEFFLNARFFFYHGCSTSLAAVIAQIFSATFKKTAFHWPQIFTSICSVQS